jgi:hypothetical protein
MRHRRQGSLNWHPLPQQKPASVPQQKLTTPPSQKHDLLASSAPCGFPKFFLEFLALQRPVPREVREFVLAFIFLENYTILFGKK